MRCHHHAAAQTQAMQPLAIAEARLPGVSKGVTKIQNRTQALLSLKLPNDMRLDLATALDGVRKSGGLTGKESVDIGFAPVQKRHVGNQPVFDAFSQPGAQLPGRRRFKKIQSAHHQLRLIQRALIFLPSGWSILDMPPTDESICASNVVGTCTNGTPHM